MRKFFAFAVLLPLAILIVVFAVANRHAVLISLDPRSGEPTLALSAPLFVVLLATLALGVIVGGIAVWLRQGRWRRTARRAMADRRALHAENEALQQQVEAAERAAAARMLAPRSPPAA
jgi:uncharacterized integral membrane protein